MVYAPEPVSAASDLPWESVSADYSYLVSVHWVYIWVDEQVWLVDGSTVSEMLGSHHWL